MIRRAVLRLLVLVLMALGPFLLLGVRLWPWGYQPTLAEDARHFYVQAWRALKRGAL